MLCRLPGVTPAMEAIEMGRRVVGICSVWFVLLAGFWTAAPANAAFDLPPIPEDGHFVQDYAGLLDARTLEQIEPMQRLAYEQHHVPIMVVTIRSLADYGAEGAPIHYFARQWFDYWEIGKRDERGRLYNKGILLLISRGDRQVRIELGAEWGGSWDDHAERIMNRIIIPEFEQLDFDSGTLAGVDALAHMAELGPLAEPPARVGSLFGNLDESPWLLTPFSMGTVLLLAGFGVLAFVAAWLLPKHRKVLLIAGSLLITAALVLWALIALAALFCASRMEGHDDGFGGGGMGAGGGFSAGGGGFGGGGFSGGGGASGSF